MTQTANFPIDLDHLLLSQSELDRLLQIAQTNSRSSGGSGSLPELDGARLVERIAAEKWKPLGSELTRWIEGYQSVGHRGTYLWQWCRCAVEITTLPCVSPDVREHACETKTLGVMLDVLLDDVADRGGGINLLECLLAIIESGNPSDKTSLSPDQVRYVDFAHRLWKEIVARTQTYPRNQEFSDLLAYDYRQLCNVMRYSHLSNRCPEIVNETEHDVYTPHNMHIMICSSVDLMASPGFDRRELGRLREMMWHAQCMGRIGNLLTTWEREVKDRDFTSGVFAHALSTGAISIERLFHADDRELIEFFQCDAFENYYLNRWQTHRQFLIERGIELKSFDVRELLEGFEMLICLHLGSRGKK